MSDHRDNGKTEAEMDAGNGGQFARQLYSKPSACARMMISQVNPAHARAIREALSPAWRADELKISGQDFRALAELKSLH